jgi:hypothetical protein
LSRYRRQGFNHKKMPTNTVATIADLLYPRSILIF